MNEERKTFKNMTQENYDYIYNMIDDINSYIIDSIDEDYCTTGSQDLIGSIIDLLSELNVLRHYQNL